MIRHHARRGAEGGFSVPGIYRFRKENRGRNRQSITISPTRFKISTALCINDSYLNLLVSTIYLFWFLMYAGVTEPGRGINKDLPNATQNKSNNPGCSTGFRFSWSANLVLAMGALHLDLKLETKIMRNRKWKRNSSTL